MLDLDRQKNNLALCRKLEALIRAHPSLRFGQLLVSGGFVLPVKGANTELIWAEEYFVEPRDLLKRVNETASAISIAEGTR